MSQTLGELITRHQLTPAQQAQRISGLSQDSRTVQRGNLYLAVPGASNHGLQYLDAVQQQGAAAILAEPDADWPTARIQALAAQLPIPLISYPGLHQQLAQLAQRHYSDPGQAMQLTGVTGTNGKTSVTHYLAQALEQLTPGQAGIIGTLGAGRLSNLHSTRHTTPDLISLYAELARQRTQGIRQVMLEVSSHALAQGRVAGLRFTNAIFTNLTRDHQDYHGSMAAYGAAKAKLFHTPGLEHAVIQTDDPFGQQLISQLTVPDIIAVGTRAREQSAHYIQADQVNTTTTGLHIHYRSSWGNGTLRSSLWGRYNADNLLLALGILLSQGTPLADANAALAQVHSAPGRMHQLGGGAQQPQVLIDYAHTPDALQQTLQAAREHVSGRLICVFGCGGDRDPGKRPQMGAIAEQLADQIWVTDDNPRTERSTRITADILAGMTQPDQAHLEHHRPTAIAAALAESTPEDLVLIAGKGHESYQEVGTQRQPYSDFEQVNTILNTNRTGAQH
jgi:UDP-N-acetylmuramoyl-L-alanyl-D-glutamate--2,6-diaminopimelate ligase